MGAHTFVKEVLFFDNTPFAMYGHVQAQIGFATALGSS